MRVLAWRNLVHDKVRLLVTLTGIVFAVVLIVVELGLFLGFTTATSSLIDHSRADLWITAPRVPYIEQAVPFSERKVATVLATPGVARAAKYIVRFTQWKRPDGRQESVQIVGVEPAASAVAKNSGQATTAASARISGCCRQRHTTTEHPTAASPCRSRSTSASSSRLSAKDTAWCTSSPRRCRGDRHSTSTAELAVEALRTARSKPVASRPGGKHNLDARVLPRQLIFTPASVTTFFHCATSRLM